MEYLYPAVIGRVSSMYTDAEVLNISKQMDEAAKVRITHMFSLVLTIHTLVLRRDCFELSSAASSEHLARKPTLYPFPSTQASKNGRETLICMWIDTSSTR